MSYGFSGENMVYDPREEQISHMVAAKQGLIEAIGAIEKAMSLGGSDSMSELRLELIAKAEAMSKRIWDVSKNGF